MTKYVLAFLFTADFKSVWLIKKTRPQWQAGSLNGIGGKIESDETPIEAIIREIREESGVTLAHSQLTAIGQMDGVNNDESPFEVHIFTGVTDELLTSQEIEEVALYPIEQVRGHRHIENVPMLIETCLYRLTGKSYFCQIKMVYNQKLKDALANN